MTQQAPSHPRGSREFPLGLHSIRAGRGQDAHANAAVWAPAIASMDVHWRREDGVWASETLVGLDGGVHHGVVGPVHPGTLYAFWPTGEDLPGAIGETQLLLDPYSRAIEPIDTESGTDEPPSRSYYSVFLEHEFDWGMSERPGTPWRDTVIYEAHVKGLTKLHPDVPEALRGTYAGLGHPAMVGYLQDLGVTAVELLPVHFHIDEPHLEPLGLSNYWGYNTLGFFAPHADYAANRQAGQQVQEFKSLVKAMHTAGIEVILDVVYNHTAEGNHLGPTLSMKGIDNAAYYRLVDDDKQYYMDYTGTGNSLNVRHPHSLQLIMDSLRYWVTEMHVDGFRFDLASALAREFYDVDRLAAFFELVQQDPIVSQVKLIAEPWDVGPGGYQVGNFPPQWTEWNGAYRDVVRDFWRGEPALGE
ncbi:MAG: isoamylase, partial [Micrococcaceae bacterium]|nr:isoamylase [Micrococcaceae bacterium]